MDPTQAIEAAKTLGTGSERYLLALAVIVLAGAVAYLGRTLFLEMKACNLQMLDLTTKKIESDNKLAGALEGLEKVIETAMRAKT